MMKSNVTRIATLTIALLACVSVAACGNTFHGAGEDMENAGEAVQDASGE